MAIADEFFPSRISREYVEGVPQDKNLNVGVSGWEPEKRRAVIPMGENGYDRTIRLNDALQAIHLKRTKGSYLGRAIEEAKTHLIFGKDITGNPRRDELYLALKDLRAVCEVIGFENESHETILDDHERQVYKIATIRAGAIIRKPIEDEELARKAKALLFKARELFRKNEKRREAKGAPNAGEDFDKAVEKALANIESGHDDLAGAELSKYFGKNEMPPQKTINLNGQFRGGGEGSPFASFKWFDDAAHGTPQITTSDADMLDEKSIKALNQMAKNGSFPRMTVIPLGGSEVVPTIVGKGEKAVMSGAKIRAKKLALTVGPIPPRIFVRKIRRDGGTILIDASGSMGMTPETLRSFARKIPMGTIAYYSGRFDSYHPDHVKKFPDDGELVIFAQNGRRFDGDHIRPNHGGNYVDLNAIQWLLKQPGPRYIVTDTHWTGPAAAVTDRVFNNALSHKLLKHAHNFEQLVEMLPQMQEGKGLVEVGEEE